MENKVEICSVCENPLDKCVCCAECGHICSLDYGELYCPICFPEKKLYRSMDKDKYFMQLALKEAETAFAKGEVPVGAVLVIDDKVIALAHNMRESTNDPTAHAELIVLREGAKKINTWRLEDSTLYVTKEPCVMCAGAMVNARVGRLVYGCKDEKYGAVNSRYRLLHELNHHVRVVAGVMEKECTDILKKFFVKLRDRADK